MGQSLRIPDSEFADRWRRLQAMMADQDLDVLIAHGDEADPANVRYLSDYWPLFETGGVALGRSGDPLLLIGPESLTFAQTRGRIAEIRQLLAYRESAEPCYPGVQLDQFADVFDQLAPGGAKRIGIAGLSVMPVTVYQDIVAGAGSAQVVRADDLLCAMRTVKSEAEVACLREAFRISEAATSVVLEQMKPGMTEQEVVGLAQGAMYAEGAEYEGHPTYVLSGVHSTHAIGRPAPKVLQQGELIQLNIGARVEGYTSSVGRPVCFGPMPDEMRRLVESGLAAHYKTAELMRAGVRAGDVVAGFEAFCAEHGCADFLLYGPCHSIGLMEVERPWMESNSEYPLEANMTFQVDTFLYETDKYGLRWEDGVRVTDSGVEWLSDDRLEVIEL